MLIQMCYEVTTYATCNRPYVYLFGAVSSLSIRCSATHALQASSETAELLLRRCSYVSPGAQLSEFLE